MERLEKVRLLTVRQKRRLKKGKNWKTISNAKDEGKM